MTLAVGFATLADATNYVARTTLEATAKNISVVVENSAIVRSHGEAVGFPPSSRHSPPRNLRGRACPRPP